MKSAVFPHANCAVAPFFAFGIYEWPLRFDNPTILGWSVVAVYGAAALLCACAASKGRDGATMWRTLAIGLLFLGINKQLNLQTLLIALGRHLAMASNWFGHRRLLEAVFTVVFALAAIGILTRVMLRWRPFFKQHRLAFIGLIDLLIFVLLRAASIDRIFEDFGLNLHDKRWAWILEMFGSMCIALDALQIMWPVNPV